MKTITFTCSNCRKEVTECVEPLVYEVITALGGCCDACNGVAEAYFASSEYRMFEEAEADHRY